jgi:integrase
MPRRNLPRLCRHRPSGRAYVTDPESGRQVPMGAWGTPEADAAYAAWLEAFVARRREAPGLPPAGSLTCDQLAESFLGWADAYYLKDGVPTSEPKSFAAALRHAHALYGPAPAASFGPAALRAARERMVAAGWKRRWVNAQTRRLVRVWKWAVERELLPETCWRALEAVTPLAAGRSAAPEGEKVEAVAAEDFEATLPHLTPRLAALARVHLYGCMRGVEARILRPCDLRPEGALWLYTPRTHKTAHRGRKKEVWLGPKAQETLRPWLEKCPSPTHAVFHYRGKAQTLQGYHRSVKLACARASAARGAGGLPAVSWSPRQLRHTGLTLVRAALGREAARAVGGHANAATTDVYADPSWELARRAALELG